MIDIKFMANGLEIFLTNGTVFIAYQSISYITPVKVQIDYSNYDLLTQKFVGEEVSKYVSFTIILTSKKEFEIVLKDSYKYFPRLTESYKKKSFLQKIFNNNLKEGCSNVAYSWLQSNSEMKDAVKKSNTLRKKIIKEFNNWKF